MTCYAIGYLEDVEMGPEIITYIENIDATLSPFGGYFVIHGGPKHMLEGTANGDLIIIAFPDMARARSWYHSPAYQRIIHNRLDHSVGTIFLMQGVDANHRATDILSA